MSAGLNCKPGDLAVIVGVHPSTCLNDRFVRLTDEPPLLVATGPHWRLVEPVYFRMQFYASDALGTSYIPGDLVVVEYIADASLRPIRDPGPDAVDQMLLIAGAPNYDAVTS